MLFSCENTKIATSYSITINRRMLEPTKKRYPTSKDKQEATERWYGGWAIMIKSNPIPAGWVTYKLENNNFKEIIPLL